MAQTALEKIAAIEAEAKAKIDTLKAEAASELVKRISAVKSELAALQAEYETLTGKPAKEGKAGGSRKRLSADEKAALVITVSEIIRKAKEGISMGQIVQQAGESVSAVREAVKAVKGVKKSGAKASTLYFVK